MLGEFLTSISLLAVCNVFPWCFYRLKQVCSQQYYVTIGTTEFKNGIVKATNHLMANNRTILISRARTQPKFLVFFY